ncbi:putative alanine racemase-domain-containing protein [Phlyctochytrium arcticum]|nr:putative alanine racemase-domain-containing protein [Phlyctochytrium arcticum]
MANENDWISRPLVVIDALVKEEGLGAEEIRQRFTAVFGPENDLSLIPSLNSSQVVRKQTLVRFRCMVQDNSFNSQEYFKDVTLRNLETGETKTIPTLYRDAVSDLPGYVVVEDDSRCFTPDRIAEKHPVFCVSVPGEMTWVREGLDGGSHHGSDIQHSMNNLTLQDSGPGLEPHLRSKLPIPTESHARAAFVKTYGPDPGFQLNDVIEVLGVIEYAQPETAEGDEEIAVDTLTGSEFAMPVDGAEHSFFRSIPRIHVLLHRKLDRSKMNPATVATQATIEKMGNVDPEMLKDTLIGSLATALMGDRLAAEYVLLHLLSKIHHRTLDETPVGFFPLSICGCPPAVDDPAFSSTLANLLKDLVPRFQYLPLRVKSLNEEVHMVPAQGREDGSTTNLDSVVAAGLLQLADGTSVLVDETCMEDGLLRERGIRNLQHLQEVIRSAKLPYIIQYGEMRRDVDLRMLVISQGRCLFGIDCAVPLVRGASTEDSAIPPEILSDARTALEYYSTLPYEVPPQLVELIGRQFAEQRSSEHSSGQPITSNLDLSRRLEIARLVVKSLGRTELDVECWEWAGRLEAERVKRVRALPERKEGPRPRNVPVTTAAPPVYEQAGR